MRIPRATYRLQFTPGFGFRRARAVLPYLRALGLSDLYASPIFRARTGSTHGYDVTDPRQLNPELGDEADFEALAAAVQETGLGWLQDIVPNHMAFSAENPLLVDLLENGASSRYYRFFDIQWEHFYPVLRRRLLAPFLGGFYGEELESGRIRLTYGREGFAAVYYDLRFPLRIETYRRLLTPCLEQLRRKLGEENADYIQLLGVLYVLETLHIEAGDPDRYNQVKFIKSTLWSLFEQSPDIRRAVQAVLRRHRGRPGHPESCNPLDALLAEQNFRLAFWKVATEEINYRRFFSINDLISLHAEREEVFAATHDLILRLVRQGVFTGLRIDHIDGLYHPGAYLERLRQEVGELYLVVEKILEIGEPLPAWPVEGSTGYEFMNRLTGLFCRQANEKAFSRLYAGFTGLDTPYEELVHEKKRLIIERHMTGDITNLAYQLKNIASRYRHASDITMVGLRRSLIEIMAFFPVYRSYLHPQGGREVDGRYIGEAIRKAAAGNPGLANELAFLQKILLLEIDDFLPAEAKAQWQHFVMCFQQFTGPLMAKGFEDTLLYVYNRLLALNEVGGAPERFGFSAAEIHDYFGRRRREWPHALSASATHDAKRGEDVRARLNVLSELPQEWGRQLKAWSRLNSRHKGRHGRRRIPTKNDEYFLYQTLLGSWPFGDFDRGEYLERIRAYVVKAVREAKVHTAWIKPDAEYEETYLRFVERILDPSAKNLFLPEFLPFQKRIAHFGLCNGLAQTLLKITAPGVPDFYQGTELWDLTLVDPDNRRPVDYDRRHKALQAIRAGEKRDLPALVAELLARPEDGRVKLFLIYRALAARRSAPELFRDGDYLPLETAGARRENLFAFARRHQGRWAVTVVPRFVTDLVEEGGMPLGEAVWGETRVVLPAEAPERWREALAGGELAADAGGIAVAEALGRFPVALLTGG